MYRCFGMIILAIVGFMFASTLRQSLRARSSLAVVQFLVFNKCLCQKILRTVWKRRYGWFAMNWGSHIVSRFSISHGVPVQ